MGRSEGGGGVATWQLTDPSTSLSSCVTLLSLKGRWRWPLSTPRMTLPRPAWVMLPPRVFVLSQQPKSMRWRRLRPPRREGEVEVTVCWYRCRVKMKWESRPWALMERADRAVSRSWPARSLLTARTSLRLCSPRPGSRPAGQISALLDTV